MRNLVEQYELVKEYRFIFEGIEPTIKARIYKIVIGANSNYMWSSNYYCRLPDEATIYIPGGPYADSVSAIEEKMKKYIARFSKAEEWKENDFF